MSEDRGDVTEVDREEEMDFLRGSSARSPVEGERLAEAVFESIEPEGEGPTPALSRIVLGLLSATTEERVRRLAVDAAADVFDFPASVVWAYREGDGRERLTPAAGTDPVRVDECGPLGADSPEMAAYRAGEPMLITDPDELAADGLPSSLDVVVLAPIGDCGLLGLGRSAPAGFGAAKRQRIEALARAIETTLRRIEHERRLERRTRVIESLQGAMRQMVKADDEEEICEIAVGAAKRVLGLPLAAVWLRAENARELRPVAWGDSADDLFDEFPVYTEGNSLSWRAYEAGETLVLDDVTDREGVHDPDTPIRSEIIVPISEYGVLNSGSTEPETFDEGDAALADLLAENTAVALERADRERALERQTDRMEFFNSILRHAVLNGMTVIRSRADVIADGVEGELRGEVETILGRCDGIVEVVQRVHDLLDTLTAEDDRPLHPVDLPAAIEPEVDRIRSAHPEATVAVDDLPAVCVEADDLLSDVLGNLLSNAVEHNDPADLRVDIGVEADRDTVTVRVADDGRGIPDEEKASVFRRDETGHAKTTGSGFGLFFVDAMVSAYGGEVWVEDNDDGGATVVVELVRSDREVANGHEERS